MVRWVSIGIGVAAVVGAIVSMVAGNEGLGLFFIGVASGRVRCRRLVRQEQLAARPGELPVGELTTCRRQLVAPGITFQINPVA